MKKVNVRNLVFGAMMALMLVAAVTVYVKGTAKAVEETKVETEETNVDQWVCGDYANAETKANRFVNELHTGHMNYELYWVVPNVDYDGVDQYEVFYMDLDRQVYCFRYFYD